LPVGSRFFTATMVQIGAELEESARIHGGSWLRTFLRIWAPLLRPAIVGAWILLFVIAVRVLDLAVLLAGPGSRMLSVDIFLWTVTGRQEAASVLALLQTALVVAGYVGARWLLGRAPTQAVRHADRLPTQAVRHADRAPTQAGRPGDHVGVQDGRPR